MATQQPLNAAARFYHAFYHWGRQSGFFKCTTRPYLAIRSHSHTNVHHVPRFLSPPTSNTQRRSKSSHASNTPNSGDRFAADLDPETPTQRHPGKHPPELSHYMRWLMRRIPQPVVVITTSSTTSSTSPPTPRAMTVSSFTTVTLTPTPHISFNVRKPSSTYDAMTSDSNSGTFLIHLLSASPAGATIADTLARGNAADGLNTLHTTNNPITNFTPETLLHDTPENTIRTSLPQITGPGILEVLHCRLAPGKELEVGDHVVLVAEVLSSIGRGEDVDASTPDPETLGLAYVMRAYRYQEGQTLIPPPPPPLKTAGKVQDEEVRRDVYTYRANEPESKKTQEAEETQRARDLQTPPLQGLRVGATRHTVGKRVNVSYSPAKRRLPASATAVERGSSMMESRSGNGLQKERAEVEARAQDDEIHRTMGLNVRRGDEGLFPDAAGGGVKGGEEEDDEGRARG